jgi:hypothetical protein
VVKFWVLLAVSLCAFAESGVTGRALDPQGKIVPTATVHLQTPAGPSLTAKTNAEGRYRFDSIADGAYSITADAPGLSAEPETLRLLGQVAINDVVLAGAAAPEC